MGLACCLLYRLPYKLRIIVWWLRNYLQGGPIGSFQAKGSSVVHSPYNILHVVRRSVRSLNQSDLRAYI